MWRGKSPGDIQPVTTGGGSGSDEIIPILTEFISNS